MLTLSACSFDTSAALLPGSGDSNDDTPAPLPGQPDAGPGQPDAMEEEEQVAMEPAFVFRMNLAGNEHIGTDYPGTWLADDGTCTGNQWVESDEVNGTVDDPLFLTNRYADPVACTIGGGALDAGDYTVTLLFGEVYRGGCTNDVGSRIYDVSAEGVLYLDDFDAVAASNGCVLATGTPTSRTFTVTVNDGTLDILADGDTNAMISAIEVVSVAMVPVVE